MALLPQAKLYVFGKAALLPSLDYFSFSYLFSFHSLPLISPLNSTFWSLDYEENFSSFQIVHHLSISEMCDGAQLSDRALYCLGAQNHGSYL